MASYFKFHDFVFQTWLATHNLQTHVLKAALTNTLPDIALDTQISDIVEIPAVNGYPAGGFVLDNNTVTKLAGGIAKLTIDDELFTAAGGTVGPFRYPVLYNSTAAGGPLIGFFDYGQPLTLNDAENITVDFDDANGVITGQ